MRLVSAVLVSILFLSGCARRDREERNLPNIVFVLLDAARADHFTCYGYAQPTTPNIDRIAAQGAIFLKAFSPATQTYNAMPLIMSSRYISKEIFPKDTWRWNIRRESSHTIFNDFDREQIFLPELLSRNGYRTAIVHDHWWFHPQTDFIKMFDEDYHIRNAQPTDEVIIGTALEWIENNKDNPFFLYLHIMSPHQPYPVKEADRIFIGEGEQSLAETVRAKFKDKPNESCIGWSETEIKILRDLYDSNLRHSDHWIGLLYSKLEEWSLAGKTLFILTSDHGEHLGEHNHLNHGGPGFDSGVHVPLILVWPGEIPGDIKIKGLCELIDIVPTIIDICSLKKPPEKSFEGVSLKNSFDDPQRGKEAVFGQDYIRTDRYKLLLDEDGNRLFDIKVDPGETANSAEKLPEIEKKLKTRYEHSMRPSRQRYQDSRKSSPPRYSFYLPVKDFTITPPEHVEYLAVTREPHKARTMFSPQKSWVLNSSDHHSGIFYFPGLTETASIIMKSPLPVGRYRISTLVEILNHGGETMPENPGLEIRFLSEQSFRSPLSVTPLKNGRYVYLDWGEVAMDNDQFELELSAASGEKPLFIHLVRFDPIGYSDRETSGPPESDELEMRKRGLKSLGYL